jgi:hypothetical protein
MAEQESDSISLCSVGFFLVPSRAPLKFVQLLYGHCPAASTVNYEMQDSEEMPRERERGVLLWSEYE